MNGISGLLAFRSFCCHVEFGSNERHQSEFQGYFREPCVCYFTPTWETSWKEYTTLYYNDVPDDMEFRSILPHHFVPHAIALVKFCNKLLFEALKIMVRYRCGLMECFLNLVPHVSQHGCLPSSIVKNLENTFIFFYLLPTSRQA